MLSHPYRLLPALALTLGLTVAANASDEQVFESGAEQNTVLELYTSEGCSSCPPADRWISQFVDSPLLWNKVIPLSFHVDYWNYLGWKDQFSDTDFSKRQRRYKKEGGLNAVYTPGVVVAGEEWRGLLEGYALPGFNEDHAGNLKLTRLGQQVGLAFEGEAELAHLVLLGTGIKSEVSRGENRGRMLQHDFVVLDYQTAKSRNSEWLFKIKPGDQVTAIAAWVSSASNQTPRQAVGGWLER